MALIEVVAVSNGFAGVQRNGVPYKSKLYIEAGNGDYGAMKYEGFIFWNIDATGLTNIKFKANVDEKTGTGPYAEFRFGYYNTSKTIDTVAFQDARTVFKVISFASMASSGAFEITDIPYQAVNNGMVIELYNYDYASNGIEFDNIGRTIKPRVEFTIVDAAVTYFNVDGNNAQAPINLSWLATNNDACNVEVYQGGALKYNYTGTTQLGLSIPANTLGEGATEFKIRVGRVFSSTTYWSNFTTQNATLGRNEPIIDNLNNSGEFWEYPIGINWRSDYQEGYEAELYQDNIKIGATLIGTTLKAFTIPTGTFVSKDNCSVRVRVYNTYNGIVAYSGWSEINLSLQDITATISNLIVGSEYWEEAINLSWLSDNQQAFRIDVLKNNVVIKQYSGTTAKSYTIAADQLTVGEHTFNVWVAYSGRYVNNDTDTVILKDILPTVENLALSGSNIDLQLIASWVSLNQQGYELTIFKNDVLVGTYTGTTATQVIIPPATLTKGLHTFKIRTSYKARWSDYEELNTTLIETLPSIGLLEPDGVIVERDNPIRIWWTSTNQSEWSLVIDGVTTYTGLSEKEKTLVAAALVTGNHTMTLTIAYVTAALVRKYATITSKFIVQGKPPTPTITSGATYTTNRPTITWDTQEQQGYIVEVLKDGLVIYTTDWQNGLVTTCKVNDYLTNGTYVVRVKTMNQYSLESDYGTKTITVNGVEATTITLDTLPINNSVELSWDNVGNKFIAFYIIRNGIVIAKTSITSYVDYTCHGECTYKIRGITLTDVFKDSNEAYEDIQIGRAVMATLDNLSDTIDVGLSFSSYNFSGGITLESENISLSGRELPVTIFGEHSNNTYNVNFMQKDLFKFLQMCKRRKTFVYRDRRQKLFLSVPNVNYSINSQMAEYAQQLIEVDYKEHIAYD